MPRSRSVSLNAAIVKLKDTAQVATRRGDLTKVEKKRVIELAATLKDPCSSGVYENFLRQVLGVAGPQMAVICAVGLGRTAIKGMKDRVRVDLPFEIREQVSSLETPAFKRVVEEYLELSLSRQVSLHWRQSDAINGVAVSSQLAQSKGASYAGRSAQDSNTCSGMLCFLLFDRLLSFY